LQGLGRPRLGFERNPGVSTGGGVLRAGVERTSKGEGREQRRPDEKFPSVKRGGAQQSTQEASGKVGGVSRADSRKRSALIQAGTQVGGGPRPSAKTRLKKQKSKD